MKYALWAVVVLAAVAVLSSCMSDAQKSGRIDAIVQSKVDEAKASGVPVTQEFLDKAKADAGKQVEAELAKKREDAVDKGGGVIVDAIGGNWPKALSGLVGLAGLLFGFYNEGKKKPA